MRFRIQKWHSGIAISLLTLLLAESFNVELHLVLAVALSGLATSIILMLSKEGIKFAGIRRAFANMIRYSDILDGFYLAMSLIDSQEGDGGKGELY